MAQPGVKDMQHRSQVTEFWGRGLKSSAISFAAQI